MNLVEFVLAQIFCSGAMNNILQTTDSRRIWSPFFSFVLWKPSWLVERIQCSITSSVPEVLFPSLFFYVFIYLLVPFFSIHIIIKRLKKQPKYTLFLFFCMVIYMYRYIYSLYFTLFLESVNAIFRVRGGGGGRKQESRSRKNIIPRLGRNWRRKKNHSIINIYIPWCDASIKLHVTFNYFQ